MHALLALGAFIASHWQAIAAGLVGLMSVIGSVKNLLDDGKHPKSEKVLDKLLDMLSFVSRYGSKGVPYLGRLSVPGLPSRPVPKPAPDLKSVP